ncbi:MAG: PD-(D/E)XK nuclease family transposase [Synergistaceae bacterium]|nr:PD-(D/E)XK nuclease family transposase [Synergistaceae bacterium]
MPERKPAFTINDVIKEIEEATLMDDYFMRAFFEDNISGTQIVLRIIMDKPDLIVMSVSVQEDFRGFDDSHGVRFDVYAVDSENRQYDIEFQNKPEGASPQRADFNSAMLTVRTLKKSENYSVLSERERVVIFITKTDVLKGGLPIYRVERVIRETGNPFNDGTRIIYVNTSHKDTGTALGKLVHDFRCGNLRKLYYTELAEQADNARKKAEQQLERSYILKKVGENRYRELSKSTCVYNLYIG